MGPGFTADVNADVAACDAGTNSMTSSTGAGMDQAPA